MSAELVSNTGSALGSTYTFAQLRTATNVRHPPSSMSVYIPILHPPCPCTLPSSTCTHLRPATNPPSSTYTAVQQPTRRHPCPRALISHRPAAISPRPATHPPASMSMCTHLSPSSS